MLVATLVLLLGVLGAPVAFGQGTSPAPTPLAAPPGPAPECTPEVEPNDQPEQSASMVGPVCLTGTLPELRDQDLVLWEVTPAEALITWRITVVGIPTTITSIHLFHVNSEPGVFPIDARESDRIDSSATSRDPGIATGISLAAGPYLLGISRGDPAGGPPAPAGEYRVTLEHEQVLPPNGDVEPNDDAATATPVSAPVALIGAVDGSPDLYRWTLDATAAGQRHRIGVRVIAGDYLVVRLLDTQGAELARTDTQRDGNARIHDLELSAGDYLIELSTGSGGAHGYELTTAVVEDALADAEPNDEPAGAIDITMGDEVSGRLAGPRDFDHYRFEIPQALAASQVDVALRVGSSLDRRVCLVGPDGRQVQCRQGRGDIVLSNLSLAGGAHVIEVSGEEDLADHYRLSVADIGLVSARREVEPNDSSETASAFDPGVTIHGRSANNDPDHYRITTRGEPQVWRLEATGSAIRSLLWLEPDGDLRGTADVSPDGTRASLWDLYLIPGSHWIMFQSEGEDYTLTLTPLGPLPEGMEREPNDDPDNAEPLDIGEVRTGRVPGPADTDVLRFSLEQAEHLVLRLEPPADGALRVRLSTGGTELVRVRDAAPGQPWVYDALLELGDYELTLTSDVGSVDPYRLVIDRADPWALPADLEPNDVLDRAWEMPAALVVSGTGWGVNSEDEDWYRIPTVPDPSQPIVVRTEGPVRDLWLSDGSQVVYVDGDAARTTWTSRQLPGSGPFFLHVNTGGDYRLAVGGGGLEPAEATEDLPIGATLTPATDRVSAYETFGQEVDASLALVNEGSAPVDLVIAGWASDDRWVVRSAMDRVTVPAGGSMEVPVTVDVPPDTWGDVPTRIALRVASGGRGVSAWTDITPDRDASPVSPYQAWPVPEELLGGLDVASLALGATIVSPTFDPRSEELLHDGLALAGSGFIGTVSGAPATFTMDLATDDPVPVAGLIIDPLGGTPTLAASPRLFDLELSLDGTTWETVLSGEVTPRLADQPFVLDAPVEARLARLSIRSTWSGERSSLQMGEWQVIATPGWAPAGTINVADPRHGGHVVDSQPGLTDPRQGDGMLSEDLENVSWEPYLEPEATFSWVVGFRDGRAPQVTELQWVDVAGSEPAQRFDSVTVEVSTETPLGPWEAVGTWDLTRAEDRTVAPFAFAEPTWARYLRFTGEGPGEHKDYRETPVVLRVVERPTDGIYRSIIGAWGRTTPTAIRELLLPPDLTALPARTLEGDGDDHPAGATPLTETVPLDAHIQRGEDIDWYTVTVPAGDNTLELDIEAPPVAGIEVRLTDLAGRALPLVPLRSSSPIIARYQADVVPGETYLVRLVQPPFSTVFTYDTSGSLGRVLTYVSTALRGFAADVRPGEEVVQIMPFEEKPLLPDWSDERYLIEDSVAGVFSARGSSAAESSMLQAAQMLAMRPGARAMLVVTDAETASFHQNGALWLSLSQVRPIVFTVHVAGGGAPALTTNLMQDWANSWGGHYEYAASHAELDRAFDRLATWLRRPASYRISFDASFVDHSPGNLSLEAPPGPGGAGSVVAGSGVGVEILLDTSGSMRDRIGKRTRISIARDVLRRLVGETLPEGLPVALRTFDPARRCGSTLLAPLGPLDRESMLAKVKDITAAKATRTPLAATLGQVANDLAQARGKAIVVLITDGDETCQGDPEAVIRGLIASGLDVRINIVGFAIDDEALQAELERWAQIGGGEAFGADDAESLDAGIAAALAAPYRVLDEAGEVVGEGAVGGDPVSLPPGSYTVEVLTDPVRVIEDVVITPGGWRRITVGVPEGGPGVGQ
jgi:hypothetical protein